MKVKFYKHIILLIANNHYSPNGKPLFKKSKKMSFSTSFRKLNKYIFRSITVHCVLILHWPCSLITVQPLINICFTICLIKLNPALKHQFRRSNHLIHLRKRKGYEKTLKLFVCPTCARDIFLSFYTARKKNLAEPEKKLYRQDSCCCLVLSSTQICIKLVISSLR